MRIGDGSFGVLRRASVYGRFQIRKREILGNFDVEFWIFYMDLRDLGTLTTRFATTFLL